MRHFLVLLISLAFTTPVSAQQIRCLERGEMLKAMIKNKAVQHSIALSENRMIEVYVRPGNEWAMLVTGSNGITCMVMTGTDWNHSHVKPVKPSMEH